MSLYRKYRPKDFVDVVGQEHIVTTLEHAIEHDLLAHAYLFAGTRGTGKTSVARILAKHLMIRGIQDEQVKSHIVRGVEEGHLVDLLEIDGASNRGIDDIRDLIEKIQFSPTAGAAKVYIIDEVHMLTREAFNALLKTLEEPPAYAYFILATTELYKVPVTIQSRCQCFPFRKIREEDIVRRLQLIVDQERIGADREALRAIVRYVDGGLRDAISLLDQLRNLSRITKADVEERVGGTGMEQVNDVFQAIAAGDSRRVVELVRTVEHSGVAMDVFLRQMLTVVREHMHQSLDDQEQFTGHMRTMSMLLQALRDLRVSPVSGLVVESAFLQLCQKDGASSTVLSGGTEYSRSTTAVPSATNIPVQSARSRTTVAMEKSTETPELSAPISNSPGQPGDTAVIQVPALTLDAVRQNWTKVLADVTPPKVRMSLKNGLVHAVEGNRLILVFSSAFHRDTATGTEASRTIEKVLYDIFRQPIYLKGILAEGESVLPVTETGEAVNLAQAASEIFG